MVAANELEEWTLASADWIFAGEQRKTYRYEVELESCNLIDVYRAQTGEQHMRGNMNSLSFMRPLLRPKFWRGRVLNGECLEEPARLLEGVKNNDQSRLKELATVFSLALILCVRLPPLGVGWLTGNSVTQTAALRKCLT